jgi:hypothetical protein
MTTLGKVVLTLLILGAAGLGAYKWWDRLNPAAVSGAIRPSASVGRGQRRW